MLLPCFGVNNAPEVLGIGKISAVLRAARRASQARGPDQDGRLMLRWPGAWPVVPLAPSVLPCQAEPGQPIPEQLVLNLEQSVIMTFFP